MKIAIVHNLTSGGGKRALYEYTRLLKKQGHTLDAYNLSLTDERFLSLVTYANRLITSDIEEFRLIQTRFLPFIIQYLNLPRKIAYLHKLDKRYAQIAREIDQQSYDLVFVNHCKVVQSPYILQHLRTPSVYYCQEPPRRIYDPPILRGELITPKQKIQSIWYKPADGLYHYKVKYDDYHSARSASLVLANSYFSRESIYRAYRINARVNYLGVDVERFKLPSHHSHEKQHLVISVGRTYPEKGYDFIIKALSYIPGAIRPHLLILADMRNPVEERYFSHLAQEGNVKFEIQSIFSDVELVNWYCKAKLFVYGSVMEPLGIAPLEAMACGLPVVAVKEGGVRETVLEGKTGFLTQRDPREFAEKVQLLLEDPDLRKRYGEQGRQYVETFWTWEQSVQELLENFKRVQVTNRVTGTYEKA